MMSQEDQHYAEVTVYGYKDPKTPIDVLQNAVSPKFLEQIKAEGAGQITLALSDEKLAATPSLLDYRNVVKLSCDGVVRSAFLINNHEDNIIGAGEESEKAVTISGNGLRQWLADAVVMPEGGLRQSAPDSRVFSWASQRGSWYNANEWKTPTKIERYHIAPDGTKDLQYTYNPAEWPDAGNAYWVWSRAFTYETRNGKRVAVTPEGNSYFRYEFTVTEANAGSYSLFAAADDSYVAFVDSALAIDGTTPAGTSHYHETVRYDFELEAGKHVLAFRVNNRKRNGTNRNPAALIAALFQAGDADAGTAARLITQTGNSGWLVNGYPAKEPGWSVGEILLTLLAEAKARGVRFPNWLTPTFTNDKDSNGVAWGDSLAFSFNVGDSYLDVIKAMEELAVDVWIDPATYKFNVVQTRGVDRSTVVGTRDAVVFEEGKNLLSASLDGQADLTNSLVMQTDDGWIKTQPSDPKSQSDYGVVEGSINTSVNSTLSKKLSDKVFAQKAFPETGSSYTILPHEGTRPFTDFVVGDYVAAPDAQGKRTKRRVSSIAITTDTAGIPTYAVEFDTIFETKQEEYDRIAKLVSGSGLGSGFVSGDGAGSGGTSPSTGTGTGYTPGNPVPPANIRVTSSGYFTAQGAARAKATVTWDPVTLDVNGVAVKGISKYEVYARYDTTQAYQLLGSTTGSDTSLTVQNLNADDDIFFVMMAYVDSSRTSSMSPPVLHHSAKPVVQMLPPTAPKLTSKLGTVTATWDGKLTTGNPPAQFRYLYAESQSGTAGWVRAGTTLASAGEIIIANLPVGSSVSVRFYAVDSTGVASTYSAQTTITVTGVDTSDLGQQFEDDYQAIKDQAAAAQQDAADAQEAAQAAQDAAEAAAGASGGILYQEATPAAVDRGRLWIKPSTKESFVWDNTANNWVKVTDPALAQAAADALAAKQAAQQAGQTAQTAAEQAGLALSAANGKNTNWYLDEAPAGSVHAVGDTWFDTNNDYAMSRWDGSNWVLAQFGNAAFSGIDAGKISTGFLDAGRIQSATITSRMLAVGDLKDYFDGSDFENPAFIPWLTMPDQYSVIDNTVAHGGSQSMRMLPPAQPFTPKTTYNLTTNPKMLTTTTNWSGLTSGTGAVLARGSSTDPLIYQGLTTYARLTFGTGASAASAGIRYSQAVTAGTVYSVSTGVSTRQPNLASQFRIIWLNSSGAEVGSRSYSDPVVHDGSATWQVITRENMTAPAGAVTMNMDVYGPSGATPISGQNLYMTGVMVNVGPTVLEYFDGDDPSVPGADEFSWTGTAGNSTSKRVQSSQTTTRTNLVVNPRYASIIDQGTVAYSSAGGASATNVQIYRVTGVANPTGSTGGTAARLRSYSTASLTYMDNRVRVIAVTPGKSYTASMAVRLTSAAGATGAQIYTQWFAGDPQAGGTLISTISTAYSGRWSGYKRFYNQNRSAPAGATHAVIVMRVLGTFTNGQYVDTGAVSFLEGDSLDYFDGSYPNTDADTYNWNATADNSATIQVSVADRDKSSYTLNTDVPVKAGQSFFINGWVLRTDDYNGNVDGAYIALTDPTDGTIIGGKAALGIQAAPTTNEWVQIGATIPIPDGVSTVRPVISMNHSAGLIYLDDLQMKVSGVTLIQDGSITTEKFAAGSVTTNVLAAGAVTAGIIAADAITATQLSATAITSKHTITGAVIQTATTGARTVMNASGLQVLDSSGSPLVRLGYGISTGMSIADPNTGSLVPLSNMSFGTKFFPVSDSAQNASKAVPVAAADNQWGSYTSESQGNWVAPSSRVMWLFFALTDSASQQNYRVEGQAYLIDSTDTSVGARVTLTNAISVTWTGGFYMGVKNVVMGRQYAVTNSYRAFRNYTATGQASVVSRLNILMPV